MLITQLLNRASSMMWAAIQKTNKQTKQGTSLSVVNLVFAVFLSWFVIVFRQIYVPGLWINQIKSNQIKSNKQTNKQTKKT